MTGNKIDKVRFVSFSEGFEKAKKNADSFEVSALNGQNMQYHLDKLIEYLKPFVISNINSENQSLISFGEVEKENMYLAIIKFMAISRASNKPFLSLDSIQDVHKKLIMKMEKQFVNNEE